MNLKKYAELKAAKQKEMADLVELVKNEERAMTTEEDTKFSKLEEEIKAIDNTVEKINKSRELTEEKPSDTLEDNDKNKEKTPEETEKREKIEIENFGKYIRNEILERADETNFEKGTNGVIVGTTIANKIIMTAYNVSPILSKCTPYNTKGKVSIPVYRKDEKGNDITVGYSEDFQELVAKAGKFGDVELTEYLVGALTKLGNSLINNTDIDLGNKAIEIIADYVRRFLEGEALNGTEGKIVGCSEISRIHEVSTPAITYDDLVKLKNKVIQVFRKGSFWVMNQDTETALELIKDADGRPLFQSDPTGEFDGKILGYPVYVSDNMPGIETGKRPIIFGNFSGLALKTTKDLEIKVLRELYATQHATGIVAWLEVDARIEHFQKLAALQVKSTNAE